MCAVYKKCSLNSREYASVGWVLPFLSWPFFKLSEMRRKCPAVPRQYTSNLAGRRAFPSPTPNHQEEPNWGMNRASFPGYVLKWAMNRTSFHSYVPKWGMNRTSFHSYVLKWGMIYHSLLTLQKTITRKQWITFPQKLIKPYTTKKTAQNEGAVEK